MSATTSPRDRRDAGFTLPELLIAIIITGTIVSVLAMTIVTSMKTAPSVSNRADTAVAVQGITTWLPPDVDSAEPGQFDFNTSTASGCAGGDPAGSTNIIRLQWSETFNTITTTYVADYRFVIDGGTGEIVRMSCNGKFSLGAPQTMSMSAKLSTTLPVVTGSHVDAGGKIDQVTIKIVTLAGEVVFIEAATKNPNETLPPVSTVVTTTTTTTTTTSTTTTPTTAPNQPPTANYMHIQVNTGVPITFTLDGHDPENGALTGAVTNLPGGWTSSVTGTSVTLTANGGPGTATLTYTVTDPLGASSPATNFDVEILSTPTSSTTSTTSTTTTSTTTSTTSTTTTTTIPPCVVGSMTVSPNPVQLQNKTMAKLKNDVTVSISGVSGYCVGLTLQYDTGAPNNQWIRNFGTSAPYVLNLEGHPQGTELWITGTHTLYVKDGYNRLLKQANLVVTD